MYCFLDKRPRIYICWKEAYVHHVLIYKTVMAKKPNFGTHLWELC